MKLEKANQQQNDQKYKMNSLEERLEQVKKDTNEVDDRNQHLSSTIAKLENEKQDKVSEYEQKKLD